MKPKIKQDLQTIQTFLYVYKHKLKHYPFRNWPNEVDSHRVLALLLLIPPSHSQVILHINHRHHFQLSRDKPFPQDPVTCRQTPPRAQPSSMLFMKHKHPLHLSPKPRFSFGSMVALVALSMLGTFLESWSAFNPQAQHHQNNALLLNTMSSWSRIFGIVFLDNPIGAGLSFDATNDELPRDQSSVAKHHFAHINVDVLIIYILF